jgi:7-cyano-7-deazaguanine synthase
LTDQIDVPKGRGVDDMAHQIPVTYVPARNTIFLSYALAWAEVLQAADIFIGVNAVDYSGYPDCRPEFIAAYERLANLATKAAVEGKLRMNIRTPLIRMKKAEIIPSPAGKACGRCDSCILRRKGFEDAGVPDPTVYVAP